MSALIFQVNKVLDFLHLPASETVVEADFILFLFSSCVESLSSTHERMYLLLSKPLKK